MTDEITGLCRDHSFESSEDLCRRCGAEYCELCLVFPRGTSKVLCKECAMAAGGVRSHVSRPPIAKRDLRRKLKAFRERLDRRAAKAAASDDISVTDPLAPTTADLERVPATVPADAESTADEPIAVSEAIPPPPATSAPAADEPADGVAPPIDWSQPFG